MTVLADSTDRFDDIFGTERSTGRAPRPEPASALPAAFVAELENGTSYHYRADAVVAEQTVLWVTAPNGDIVKTFTLADFEHSGRAQDALAELAQVSGGEPVPPVGVGEWMAPTRHSGQTLCIDSGGGHVRIRDEDAFDDDDDDLVFWNCDEFAEDPVEVIGALCGAIANGARL